ncbi:hypothetical protein CLOSBL3_50009 [Clostridiaceae bacterium BL-3]|jgi:hypothetical protein|nr:hypothetical protein CLOSBL3_50009 [Clostridiaceae bacterium BL-3]
MTTCSNTSTSPSGSKEQLRPWITISKHQVESKLHLMLRNLFIHLMQKIFCVKIYGIMKKVKYNRNMMKVEQLTVKDYW